MIIRPDQFDALASGHYSEFESRAAAWLREHFAEDCALLGPNVMCIRIREAVQAASRYGFNAQREAMRFVYLWFLMGPNFDLKPDYAWLRDLFRQRDVDAPVRMENALERVAVQLESGSKEAPK